MDDAWTPDEGRCLMAQLLRMAMADGVFSPEENSLLDAQRARLGIALAEMDALRRDAEAGDFPNPPTDPEICERMFLELLELAASDGVGDAERKVLFDIAPDFGMSEAEVRDLLDEFEAF